MTPPAHLREQLLQLLPVVLVQLLELNAASWSAPPEEPLRDAQHTTRHFGPRAARIAGDGRGQGSQLIEPLRGQARRACGERDDRSLVLEAPAASPARGGSTCGSCALRVSRAS